MKHVAVWLIIVFAFLGIADSAYIAESEATHTPLICTVGNVNSCTLVAESPYSRLFGVPIADYGVVFYGLIFLLAASEIAFGSLVIRRSLQLVAAAGLIASAYFVFVQIVYINAICIYCVASAVFTLLIFIFAYFVEDKEKEAIFLPPPSVRSRFRLPPPLT